MLLCAACNATETLHNKKSNVSVTKNAAFSDDEIAFFMRISNEEWTRTKSVFLSKNLIDDSNFPTNWGKRQFSSDSSSERVSEYRERKKTQEKNRCNVSCNTDVTLQKQKSNALDTDTDTDVNPCGEPSSTNLAESGAKNFDDDFPPPDPMLSRSIELTAMLRKRGAALQASDPRVQNWANTGVTDSEALQALEVAQHQRHEKADSKPINAGYLDAIIKTLKTEKTQQNQRRNIHDERAETIRILTGQQKNSADNGRIIDITPDVSYGVG